MTTYYGFTNANRDEQPAWFHTPEAAQRFASACGWENATIETTDSPAPSDVMDKPGSPWSLGEIVVDKISPPFGRYPGMVEVDIHRKMPDGSRDGYETIRVPLPEDAVNPEGRYCEPVIAEAVSAHVAKMK